MTDSALKPGVKTLELKIVSGLMAAPFMEILMQKAPAPVVFWGILALACGYVLMRGISKLPLPGDDSSMNASETYVAAGALVESIAAYTHGAFSQTHLVIAIVALTACFMVSRLMAKHDWFGFVQRIFSGQRNVRDIASEVVEIIQRKAA